MSEILRREDRYDIPYRAEISGNEDKVVVAVHGFASSKESPTVDMLMEALPERGIGVIAFDFPAHGESPADGEYLSVENCVRDLGDITELVGELCPGAEICYFGSSFGAYITLIYLTRHGGPGTRAFLRSAAVNMSEYFSELGAEERKKLGHEGYFMLDDQVRPIMITDGFLRSLAENDVRRDLRRDGLRLRMIHGSSDEDIAYEEAVSFAERYGIELVTVEGGDHRLSIPGAPERVLSEALALFA